MNVISTFRKTLALPHTSWQLCLLAVLGGAAASLLVVLYTQTIELLQRFYLTTLDNDISLNLLSRIQLPLLGVLCILLLSKLTGYEYIRAGIPFVLHRLKTAYGVIPFRNTLNQFWGGALALASGFSVGKEGPAVHLGAACAGYLGQYLKLPHNSVRTLCACGIAAGISACFNTPIAAVIFVMEVILREYKVHIFIPIMLASIIGSMITNHVFGPAHEYGFLAPLSLNINAYIYLILLGIFLGVLASGFNHYLARVLQHFQHKSIVLRLITAALLTGLLTYIVPHTIEEQHNDIFFALSHYSEWQIITTLLLAKILMTIVAIGLGVPGGIIGPIIAIGAIAGVVCTWVCVHLFGATLSAGDLALMGMAGFMAATLNAPLAALLAVVELSNQLESVVPAMIVISTSCLISGQFFNNRSIFIMQLNVQNLPYQIAPVESFLQKIGVIACMLEQIKIHKDLSPAELHSMALTTTNNDYVLSQNNEDGQFYWYEKITKKHQEKVINHQLIPLSSQDTLAEAYLALRDKNAGGVYIYHEDKNNVIGMIPFETIRHYLAEGKLNK